MRAFQRPGGRISRCARDQVVCLLRHKITICLGMKSLVSRILTQGGLIAITQPGSLRDTGCCLAVAGRLSLAEARPGPYDPSAMNKNLSAPQGSCDRCHAAVPDFCVDDPAFKAVEKALINGSKTLAAA